MTPHTGKTAAAPKAGPSATGRPRYLLVEYSLPLVLFAALSLALSWPAVRDFSTKLISSGGDARHNLWVLWHYKEALLGSATWFQTDLLYYPEGASLLTHGLGPVMALFALPFWPWGPVTAHNGAVLVGFGLTGYFMYLLARGLELRREVAFFAGLMLLTAPMHMAGLWGHMTKVFLGLIPLALLALHHSLNSRRSRWWVVAAALVVLATVLHSGYQFIFTVLVAGLHVLATLLTTTPVGRIAILKRCLLLAAAGLVIVSPMLFATLRASQTESVSVSRSLESLNNRPDLVEFILPAPISRIFGQPVREFFSTRNVKPTIETAVSLSFTGLLLSLLALLKSKWQGRWWVLFTVLFAGLALGPALKLLGRTYFTEYGLPVILPFVLVTRLPGLDFIRASGRFMMVGYVTFALAAAYGLAWLSGRYPRLARPIILAASLLLLVETWPRSWPQEILRPVPQFYQQLAGDPALYGVFDLPVKPAEEVSYVGYASHYQMYQMTHGKGIPSGYLSRVYDVHPLFPCVIPEQQSSQPDVLVNGRRSECDRNFLFDLAYFDYRYVVWHRPDPDYTYYRPEGWAERQTARLIASYFTGQEPLVADDLVTVYTVPPLSETAARLSPVIGLKDNWYKREVGQRRWARSPATLYLSIPQGGRFVLEITPERIFEPGPDQVVGSRGTLQVKLDGVLVATVEIKSGQVTSIPLDLSAGVHSVSLALEAGNFRPGDYGSDDYRWLSFAIRSVNLRSYE
jgi:hypothetical protein